MLSRPSDLSTKLQHRRQRTTASASVYFVIESLDVDLDNIYVPEQILPSPAQDVSVGVQGHEKTRPMGNLRNIEDVLGPYYRLVEREGYPYRATVARFLYQVFGRDVPTRDRSGRMGEHGVLTIRTIKVATERAGGIYPRPRLEMEDGLLLDGVALADANLTVVHRP